MKNLAELYYNYVSNKVNSTISTNIISLKDSYYDLSNLKPIKGFKLNDLVTFTHTDHIIMVSPIIKYVNFCLQNIYIMVPAIIFALKPLLDTFPDKLAILLEELLNLTRPGPASLPRPGRGKFCLYNVIDKILRYIEYMKIIK